MKEGTNLTTNQKMAEIVYGAAGSPIESDEESDIIEAKVVKDEMNDCCDFANEVHLCEHCRKYLCVWIINSSRVEE
jgi:hypothetical protein